jgi:hypothetical protein
MRGCKWQDLAAIHWIGDCLEMPERLVDVLAKSGTVLHTVPVTVEGPGSSDDSEYEWRAMEAVAEAQRAAGDLTARMHVPRGGQLAPYGDDLHVQAGEGIEQAIRERAYFLWRQEGCPDGRAIEHWHQARASGPECVSGGEVP